jgi:hypothetical protein
MMQCVLINMSSVHLCLFLLLQSANIWIKYINVQLQLGPRNKQIMSILLQLPFYKNDNACAFNIPWQLKCL